MSQEEIIGTYRFGAYCVRRDDLTLTFRDTKVAIAPKVLKTLIALLDRAGRMVSKDDLMEAVWSGVPVEEANLSQNIYTLRQIFLERSGETLIETLPRRGYRFTAPVHHGVVGKASRASGDGPSRSAFATAALALITGVWMIVGAYPRPASPTASADLSTAARKHLALGWYYLHGTSRQELQSSIAAFSVVARSAPGRADGFAGEACAYARLADLWQGSPSGVSADVTAHSLAAHAIALDPRSAAARAAQGFLEFDLDGNNRAAAADLAYAVRADPVFAPARLWYGAALLWKGDVASGLVQLRRASSLDPTLPELDYLLGLGYYFSRDYDESVAYGQLASREPSTSDASRLLLAAAYEQQHRYRAAIGLMQRRPSNPSEAIGESGTLAHVYASMGDPDDAATELAAVERLTALDGGRPMLTALAYESNGRRAEAFAWLSRLSSSDRQLFARDPRLDPLRSDPRFAEWLRS